METKNITISQALRQADRLKGQIATYKKRAAECIEHRKESPTAFEFAEMLQKVTELSIQLGTLKSKIAIANANNTINYQGNTISLIEAINTLQEIKGLIAWAAVLPEQQLTEKQVKDSIWDSMKDEYVYTQAIQINHFPMGPRATWIDEMQEKYDELNAILESANQTCKL